MRTVLISFVLIFTITLLLAADSSISQNKLLPVDSLSAAGSNYSFSFPIALSAIDQELYIIDHKTSQIFVFDSDLNFLFSFGESGSYPAQFNRPLSISTDGYDYLVVSDYNNNRLQFLEKDGSYFKEMELFFPWKLEYGAQELYVDVFPGSDSAGIYAVTPRGIFLEIDLSSYFKKNNFGSVLDKYYSWCVCDWGFVLSFSGRDQVVIFDNSGKAKHSSIDELPLKYPNTLYGKPLPYQEDFLLLASSNDHTITDTTIAKVNYHNLIGKYNKKGKLIELYRLPHYVWLTDSWARMDENIFLYDSNQQKVYKFRLD